jgi:subtilisin family serine protease
MTRCLPPFITLLLIALLVLPASAQSPASQEAPHSPDIARRLIIQLQDVPLARAPNAGYSTMAEHPTSPRKLQLESPAAQRYRALLRQRQAQLFQTIQQTFPNAHLAHTYQIVFNGIAVSLPDASHETIARLRAMPGVTAVAPERVFEPTMYASLPMMNTEALWNNAAIGGQQNAGEGIKVAVVDSGIAIDNPFFNPSGYSYPPGFPKGETEYTTPKVIAARAYYRPDLPPLPGSETPRPGPEDSSHGTHVAGTIGGVSGTVAQASGVEQTISGVAPRAYLMSYKTFYGNDSVFSGMAFEPELIRALEDAVADGADVINNSWGSRANIDPHFDPISQAANGAADAGVVVVFAAGNEGPSKSTVDSRDFSGKLIMVGAATTARTIAAGFVDVTAPGSVPDTLKEHPYGSADFGPSLGDAIFGPASYQPITTLGVSSMACDPLPPDSLTGKVALLERGVCHFSVKVFHAQQAGASAVIVYNSEEGGDGVIHMAGGDHTDEITIPSIMVPRSMGTGMIDWYGQHGDAAQVQIDPQGRVIEATPDVLAYFSSRGPTFQGSLKPDVVAPGVNILSAGYANADGSEAHLGFGLSSGTSMAAPHVAGGVALLKQVHPDWSPLDIRSALMSTAETNLWLDEERSEPATVLDRGAGRVNLGRAATPGLLFNPPALSFGSLQPVPDQPTHAELVFQARNVSGAPRSYSFDNARSDSNPVNVSVTPASFRLEAGQSIQLSVSIDIPANTAPGDYGSMVYLNGDAGELHLPLWLRLLPLEYGPTVLLIDNDGSSSLELANYADYYVNALNNLGVPYSYLDVDALAPAEQTLPDISTLQKHEIIIWFTGDNVFPSGSLPVPTPLTEADQNVLISYLQSGGKLIASGQNIAEASDIEAVPPGPEYGRSSLYHYFMGARFVREDVFEYAQGDDFYALGIAPQHWVAPMRLDLTAPSSEGLDGGAHTSAGNQDSVDSVVVIDEDPRTPDYYTLPIFKAASRFNDDEGIIGLSRFSSPTLEQPASAFGYRTIYLAFGLEGVRSDTGTTTREELLQAMLYWCIDHPVVRLDTPTVEVHSPGEWVNFLAEAQTNTPASFVRYRWDFGDGSPVWETDQPTAAHQYTQPGTYHVRVEATDSWGHRAISSRQGAPTAGGEQQPAPAQPAPAAPAPAPPSAETVNFEETGQTLGGRFLEYWQQNGGLSVFGYPITPQSSEQPVSQVFERARFEYHPDQAPPYDVLLGRLGVDLLEQQGRNWWTFPTVESAPSDDCLYFAETTHSLCGAFKDYWESHGLELDGRRGSSHAESMALFGYPISEPTEETVAGEQLTVQWFERARFELHADDDGQFRLVLLGRLGSELYGQ